MFFCASFSFWVAILALLPVASAGVSGLFPLLEKCEVTVNLESMLCGACVAFDVSLLAMTDITGAFAMTFYAGNLAPFLAKWRQFLVAFVELGCTPFLVFDSLVYTFEPKLQTQAARRKTRDAAAAALQKLKAEASGLSGAALPCEQSGCCLKPRKCQSERPPPRECGHGKCTENEKNHSHPPVRA